MPWTSKEILHDKSRLVQIQRDAETECVRGDSEDLSASLRQLRERFYILTGESDTFGSDALNVVTIPDSAWKTYVPRSPAFPRRLSYRCYIDDHVRSAGLVLTLDPTVYQLGSSGISGAATAGKPVFADASATLNGDLLLLQVLKRPPERRALERCDRILVTVTKPVERFRDRRLYDETLAPKFEVVGRPVDVSTFQPQDDADRESVKISTTRSIARS